MAALCILSLRAFQTDYSSLIQRQGTSRQIALRIGEQGLPDLPLGIRGLQDVTDLCARMLLANGMVQLLPDLRADIAASCLDLADRILQDSPRHARAQALALIAAPDRATPRSYALAVQAAPFEPWPLGLRILAAAEIDALHPVQSDANWRGPVQADLLHALGTDWGRALVADLYRRKPEYRPVLRAALTLAPDADQAAFVQRLSQDGGAD